MKSKQNDYMLGVRHSIPILIGYIPSAITFGILCNTSTAGLVHAFLSSFVLYSGAAQFMLVGFIMSGVPILGIAISVFLLNSRLFLMSASLGATVDKVNHLAFPIVGWLLTDESFSILSFNKDKVNTKFALGVQIPPYFVWGIFTIVGYYIGDFLPMYLKASFSMGLLGLFVAILVPNVKKHMVTIRVVIATGIIYSIIYYTNLFPMGWDIVVSIILSSIVGIFLIGDETLEDKEEIKG
ncbi:AzlC family ABC transporter permease [Parvimonas sp. KA00067]|uniref:AzlC family ABC transporter permease n=1 Tax=Parvimonas TaxID=543311 RepID=UPI000791E7F8|nr:AzlC family ABC transporter permease [Parvimonas sp. KA00067]KXB65705.1 AzlC protein [Parvimonas sp. KA00067]